VVYVEFMAADRCGFRNGRENMSKNVVSERKTAPQMTAEELVRDACRLADEREALEQAGMVHVPMNTSRRSVLLMNPVWEARPMAGEIRALISDNEGLQAELRFQAVMFPTQELADAFLADEERLRRESDLLDREPISHTLN
jgi:hypothetical protein